MANQIRIKRRASNGATGAPTSLKNAELAYNEADNVLYYGYGDDGSGNATSIIGIAGDGSVVSLTGNQTIADNKTFTGTVDLQGALQINSVAVTATAAELNILDGATLTTVELNYLDGVTSAVQTQLNTISGDLTDANTALGLSVGDTNFGVFTGGVLTDGTTGKALLQELSDKDEAQDVITTEIDGNVNDLITLSGVNENVTNLGTFSGGTIADNRTIKEALQDLETELEDGGGSLTADDAGTADFASGTVTVSGGVGLSSTATLNTLTINLDNTTVTGGAYGAADTIGTFTVDAQGRLQAAADVSISILHTQVSDFDAGVQANTLDSLAQPTASVAMNSQKITGLADPTADQDAATKAYVDATAQGLDVKDSVRAATDSNITLSGTQTIDGVSVVAGDRVLVKNQSAPDENGIYVVASGSWARATDADSSDKVNSGMYVFVEEGTVNSDSGFILTTDNPITLGTTPLTFAQFTGAGQITAGAGMAKTGNQLDVGTASTARIVVNANDIDLALHGTAGTYNGLTVDAYGRVSSFSQPTTLAGYGITDAQGLDATLTALAGLSTSADQLIYATGSDAFALSSLSAYGRSLIDDADASAARTTLGLGSMATQDNTNVNIDGGTIDGVTIDGGTF